MSDGGAPSPAAYNPNTMGGSIGSFPPGQMWLCGWLPVLDGKRFTPMSEIANFDKPMMRTQDVKLLPCISSPALPFGSILADLIEKILSGGKEITNLAHDIIPQEIRQIMSANEIHGEDASQVRSMASIFALQNLARNSDTADISLG